MAATHPGRRRCRIQLSTAPRGFLANVEPEPLVRVSRHQQSLFGVLQRSQPARLAMSVGSQHLPMPPPATAARSAPVHTLLLSASCRLREFPLRQSPPTAPALPPSPAHPAPPPPTATPHPPATHPTPLPR